MTTQNNLLAVLAAAEQDALYGLPDLDDSHQHRHLSTELVTPERQAEAFAQLDIPWVRQPLEEQLAALSGELHEQWARLRS